MKREPGNCPAGTATSARHEATQLHRAIARRNNRVDFTIDALSSEPRESEVMG